MKENIKATHGSLCLCIGADEVFLKGVAGVIMNIAAVTALGAVSDVVALPGSLTTMDHRHVMVLP